jgi:hypothetical protein
MSCSATPTSVYRASRNMRQSKTRRATNDPITRMGTAFCGNAMRSSHPCASPPTRVPAICNQVPRALTSRDARIARHKALIRVAENLEIPQNPPNVARAHMRAPRTLQAKPRGHLPVGAHECAADPSVECHLIRGELGASRWKETTKNIVTCCVKP